ncbi:uncharacterized protein HKBW3S42_01594 [Candidatus Hakubella thermalkaliphila]|uniref:HEPN domain-containing protein n=1 Tax=Candidatus Hakubella thermalkaliphila TaxID=2754717 RepID=A0A6V8PMA0_9ACTN|nr:uncharacterized protein HKBW3S42_01594 [Candidatus Hakubella thermalkaliphila]
MKYEKEIKIIREKARENLASAELQLNEGFYDSAVSRAYYAMFYMAEAILLTKELTFSKHSAVIAAFGHHFAKANVLPKELHQHLREAFAERQKGEYEFLIKIDQAEATDILEKAKKFFEKTEEYLLGEGYDVSDR